MSRPFYEDRWTMLFHGDCEAVLPSITGSVDAVITDPPYSDWVHGKSRMGSKRSPGDKVDRFMDGYSRTKELGFEAITPALRSVVASHVARLCDRWVLVFSDVESAGLWRADLEAVGLEYVRTGAWVKLGATPQFTGDRPAAGFEAITICHPPGRKAWNGGGRHALWSVPVVQTRGPEERVHETQKPEALMAQLVSEFTDPGGLILDPFAGSGTTLVAAKRLGRRAIGIEQRLHDCQTAVRRLRQTALPLVAAAEPAPGPSLLEGLA